MCRVFANGLGDWGSIPGQVIPKTQKKEKKKKKKKKKEKKRDYKVRIKGKVDQSMEWSSALHYTSV